MKKFIVQRKVIGWIEERFYVEECNEDTINKIIAYDDLYPEETEFLYDSVESELETEVYDDDYNLLKRIK